MLVDQAVFLAGGRGSRLGAMTDDTPKPLLDVGGRPFLDHLIENVARYGIRKIIILAGYHGKQIKDRYSAWGSSRELRINVLCEPRPMGTAGALVHARDALSDTFFALNGDSFFDFNFLDLTQLATGEDRAAVIALRSVPDAGRYGRVLLNGERVERMSEKSSHGPGTINGGVYLMRRKIVDDISNLPASLESEIFPSLASTGRLFGRAYDGYFTDIGIPLDYQRAVVEFNSVLRRPAVFFDRDGVLNHDIGYLHRPADLHWRDGAIEAVKYLNDSGYFVFVVTNQAGIARGYYDERAVDDLHAWMQNELAYHGAHIDEFYYCPHHPDGTQSKYAVVCECRKPSAGLLLRAMKDWMVDEKRSFLIGDSRSDVLAAQAAGIYGKMWSGIDLLDAVKSEQGVVNSRIAES